MKFLFWIWVVSIVLYSLQGCVASPQLYVNSMVVASQPAHDYKYAGPYQFHSGVVPNENSSVFATK
jgi:hypothetical protein